MSTKEKEVVIARDIKGCSDCPLNSECNGFSVYGEKPCDLWNEDDEIYKGMLLEE